MVVTLMYKTGYLPLLNRTRSIQLSAAIILSLHSCYYGLHIESLLFFNSIFLCLALLVAVNWSDWQCKCKIS